MAAHKSIHENWLGFYPETTVCTAPANWAASGTWIEHLTCDTSGIKQTLVTDPVASRRAFNLGTRKAIKSLRNCTMAVTLPLHGTGVTTADTVQVAQTYLGTLLAHCMGNVHRSTRHAVTGGDAVEVELAAVTGLIPGTFVAFELAADPGKLHPRRIIEIAGSVVTLSEALPSVPEVDDIAHPCIVPYLDASVLVDAFNGPSTLTWFVRKSKTGTDLLWETVGTVASMKLDGLGRGALPSLGLEIMACDFKTGAADGLSNPAPTSFVGNAQLAMGLDVQMNIGEYLDDTLVSHHMANVSFEPGFTRTRVETVTEKINRAEGTATYSFAPGDTKLSVTLTPYDNAWYAGLEEGKEYRLTLYQPGDGSGAGKGWCLHMARAQLISTPGRADANENHAVTLEFKAMEAEDCVGGSNEDLERTRFALALF